MPVAVQMQPRTQGSTVPVSHLPTKGAPDMTENTHIFQHFQRFVNQAEEAQIRAFYQTVLLTFKSGQMKPRLDESNPIKFPFKTR